MLGRIFILAAASALALGSASADPAKMCDGKYALAAEMIEAAYVKYGTLYSGGEHFRRLDDVGATLDLYRFWRGYPDLKLRSGFKAPSEWEPNPNFPYVPPLGEGTTVEEIWSKAKWAFGAGAPINADVQQRFWASWGFDIITTVGPTPDWWRHVDGVAGLNASQRFVAAKAKVEPGLDWLQTVLVASRLPWANDWRSRLWLDDRRTLTWPAFGFQSLSDNAYARYKAGEGGRYEWLAAGAATTPYLHLRSSQPMKEDLLAIHDDVLTCKASPQAYAAYLVGWLPLRRDTNLDAGRVENKFQEIPDTLRAIGARAKLRQFAEQTLGSAFYGGFDAESIKSLRQEVADLRLDAGPRYNMKGDLDLIQLYLADDLMQAPLSEDAKVRRGYNLLSAADITRLARREARAVSQETRDGMIRAAFARHVALGQDVQVAALVDELMRASPKEAATIARIWTSSHAQKVRLALIVLETPDLSALIPFGYDEFDWAISLNTNVMAHRRNLPLEYVAGGVLQRDYDFFLQPNFYIRSNENRRPRLAGFSPDPTNVSVLPRGPHAPGVPFSRLIAWSELARLAGDERLMHTVSRTLVEWVDQRTRNPIDRMLDPHAYEAETLERLIRLCRYNSCGRVGGVVAQERAFQLLKYRLPGSAAARRLKYWWPSDPTH